MYQMKFIRKHITIKDSTGCEAVVLALYGDTLYINHKFVRDCDYYFHDLHTKSLSEMKILIGNLA
jgi:hypothetical protein